MRASSCLVMKFQYIEVIEREPIQHCRLVDPIVRRIMSLRAWHSHLEVPEGGIKRDYHSTQL